MAENETPLLTPDRGDRRQRRSQKCSDFDHPFSFWLRTANYLATTTTTANYTNLMTSPPHPLQAKHRHFAAATIFTSENAGGSVACDWRQHAAGTCTACDLATKLIGWEWRHVIDNIANLGQASKLGNVRDRSASSTKRRTFTLIVYRSFQWHWFQACNVVAD